MSKVLYHWSRRLNRHRRRYFGGRLFVRKPFRTLADRSVKRRALFLRRPGAGGGDDPGREKRGCGGKKRSPTPSFLRLCAGTSGIDIPGSNRFWGQGLPGRSRVATGPKKGRFPRAAMGRPRPRQGGGGSNTVGRRLSGAFASTTLIWRATFSICCREPAGGGALYVEELHHGTCAASCPRPSTVSPRSLAVNGAEECREGRRSGGRRNGSRISPEPLAGGLEPHRGLLRYSPSRPPRPQGRRCAGVRSLPVHPPEPDLLSCEAAWAGARHPDEPGVAGGEVIACGRSTTIRSTSRPSSKAALCTRRSSLVSKQGSGQPRSSSRSSMMADATALAGAPDGGEALAIAAPHPKQIALMPCSSAL